MDKLFSKLQPFYTSVVVGILIILAVALVSGWIDSKSRFHGSLVDEFNADYEYLQDPSITDYAQVIGMPFRQAEWNRAPVHFGLTNQWLKITLQNTRDSMQALRIIFDNATIDKLTVFPDRFRQNELPVGVSFGDREHDVSLEYRILPNYAFHLAPNEVIRLWVHVESEGSPYLPIMLLTEQDYGQHQRSLHLIWGAFVGIVILLSVYNLVLYVGVKDESYLHYIGYLASMLLTLSVVHGFGYYLFPASIQQILSDNIISLNCLNGFFALRFAVSFLHVDAKFKKIRLYARLIISLLIVYGCFALLMPEHIAATGFFIILTFGYITIALLMLTDIKKQFRWTRYYILSWVPFCMGAVIGGLLYGGSDLVSYTFLTRHALLFGTMFEMAFISMALADRMGHAERVRLFQAMHDVKTGFANESLLEEVILNENVFIETNKTAIVAIAIRNYESVAPYLPDHTLIKLLDSLEVYFSQEFKKSFSLFELDPETNRSAALIGANTFIYLMDYSSIKILEEKLLTLSNQDNYNPIQDIIPYRIYCDFGMVVVQDFKGNSKELLNGAKRSLSIASEKNLSYVKYEPHISIYSERNIRLAQDLERAIDLEELVLYHQPQLDLFKQGVFSEVLLRWRHPELGNIPPTEFIEIAENTGLIRRLTLFVLKAAFQQTQNLKQQGIKGVKVSVNVSANDLSRAFFYKDVEEILANFDIDASNITLEVTETSHLLDQKAFDENLIQLKNKGFCLAVDDYGTGYSSLSYLSDHFFDELKIDRSFVQKMLGSDRQKLIVETTINMAHKLGLVVTAEGIEDEATLALLKELKCDRIQGYLHAKPMPFEDYKTWLRSLT